MLGTSLLGLISVDYSSQHKHERAFCTFTRTLRLMGIETTHNLFQSFSFKGGKNFKEIKRKNTEKTKRRFIHSFSSKFLSKPQACRNINVLMNQLPFNCKMWLEFWTPCITMIVGCVRDFMVLNFVVLGICFIWIKRYTFLSYRLCRIYSNDVGVRWTA